MIRIALHCVALILGLSFSGCSPATDAKIDEQKDPHYLKGRNRVSSLDYKGAIEEFEKALETNPRSAAAHFELGLLYEEQMKNFAAAIYHYERHLQLRPQSDYAEPVRQRIKACKSDLVRSEFIAPVNQGMQRDLERLRSENLLLKNEVEKLRAQLSSRPVGTNAISEPLISAQPLSKPKIVSSNPTQNISAPVSAPLAESKTTAPPPAATVLRLYTVKSNDTVTTICKHYGIKLSQLLAANPAVDARRLRIGQTLTIPAP